ncbi:LysR family transcriptional regulator [Alicyclobacillus sp. SO9]|uniref:LysR family transcriptional regulator n=1 Tax=Alicyclobacillus sp. SO9 TaxID=2665646 RepID=UPI0018E9071E|nr:LysR family transcriptional regulator [Alicyclobacillus sp. SO9]QQE77786.1 LysR family transcriptional regulator [Alicyclobacillus sp. SO9]
MHDLLETLVTVVDAGTLLEAAKQRHLTQPTVTRQLQQLERNYQIELFHRVGKRLLLNRAGEHVYQFAKRLIVLEQKLQDELGALGDPAVGTVHLGAGITPSLYLLPQVLSSYQKEYPRVQFQVRSGSSAETQEALLNGEIDIGIVTTFNHDDSLAGTPLYSDDLLWVVSPDHPLTTKSNLHPQDLQNVPFVLMPKSSGLRKIVDVIARDHQIELQTATETDSLESISRLVQVGLGVSVLPRSAVQSELNAGRLAAIRIESIRPASRTITLVRRKDGFLPACTNQFANLLLELAVSGDLNPNK